VKGAGILGLGSEVEIGDVRGHNSVLLY